MGKITWVLLLLLILSASSVIGEEICDIKGSQGCTIEDGQLTLGKLETNAYIAASQDQVCIVYFYSDTCSHCKAIKPLIDELEQKYSDDVHLTRYEVSSPENIQLYNQLCQKHGYDGKSIPLVGVNDRILVGESEIRDYLEDEIKKGIATEDKTCPLGGEMGCHLDPDAGNNTGSEPLIPGLSNLGFTSVLPIILVAGLGDGINPCAFVILIFVMVFLQQISGSKKRLIRVTLTYIISLLATNITLGILYFTLSLQMGFPTLVKNAVIVISIIAGLLNIKDFFWYGKGVSLGIPKAAKGYLKGLINRASVPSAFILGVSVGILEAPCSVPIYLAVIEVLKGEGGTLATVFPHILIYNLMFILPLVVLSIAVYFGYKAHVLEKQTLKTKRWMKLWIGIILLLLAAALLFGWL